MRTFINRYRSIATTATLTLWCCLAQAEDIEIYRGVSSSVKPVSMMVIDTSRSMSRWAQEQWPDYDPSVDYKVTYPTDSDGDQIDDYFNPNLYYFNKYDYFGKELTNSRRDSLKERPFPKAALKCDSAHSIFETVGFYEDKFKRWNPSRSSWEPSFSRNWTPSGSGSDINAFIDCQSDEYDSAQNPSLLQYVQTYYTSSNTPYLTYKDYYYQYTWTNYYGLFFKYIYTGNYLNYLVYREEHKDTLIGAKKSRMQITKEAAKFVVDTTGGIKLGLARFDLDSGGGMIDLAATDIEGYEILVAKVGILYLPQ